MKYRRFSVVLVSTKWFLSVDGNFLFVLYSISDGQITAILDQKNYLEELNRHLRSVKVFILIFSVAEHHDLI